LNLLIVECFSGGGYSDMALSGSVLSEAYGMQRSLICDCKAAGHSVTTLFDSRLRPFNPPTEADLTFWISSPAEFYAKFGELCGGVDAVYVIAPESGRMLERLVEVVDVSGGVSLNCTVDGIKCVSNKMRFYERLKRSGLRFPETVLLDIGETSAGVRSLVEDLGYPLVFKPLDGVSCLGLSVVNDGCDVAGAVKKVARESGGKQFIAQRLVKGNAASVCMFSVGDEAVAATLNGQLVSLASPEEESAYFGGFVPFNHVLVGEALRAAQKAVELVDGLRGYVGVDMVLTDDDVFVMEINPRLTVSYVGLREVVGFNPAAAIVDAVTEGKLPKDVQSHGYSFFSKVETPSCIRKLAETYRVDGVVSPPFPVEKGKASYALISVSSDTLSGAQSVFNQSKKRVVSLCGGGD
jgi:predicted ATP-grasp superfamily ATP-dependent carboligase